jgi:aldose 1-epimerase
MYLKNFCLPFFLSITLGFFSCNSEDSGTVSENEEFIDEGEGKVVGLLDNVEIKEYVLKNKNGMEAVILNYGGIVKSLLVPDKNGNLQDVVLGFDSIGQYLRTENPYMGAIIGRYANRISRGVFVMDGRSYTLESNDNENSLHGGIKGFDKVVWNAAKKGNSLRLRYVSIDGEGGYPGNLNVEVMYELTDDNELKITYAATTDKPTPVNLTNHSYFNLSGDYSESVLNHILHLNADKYTPVDETLIPTGEIARTGGTPFDFTTPKAIGEDIQQVPGGYDHNFVLNKLGDSLTLAATLYHEGSGRFMEMFTTEPGVQFYSGNFLDGSLTGKGGKPYQKHAGLCLEAQHFPDSPNRPEFPDTILQPGEKYSQTTVYKFSIK